jgi:hypothetical protein
MKVIVFSLVVALLGALQCRAEIIMLFTDTDTFVKDAKNIVIAKCLGPVPDAILYPDCVYPVDVQVISVLHGSKDKSMKPGKAKIVTVYAMEAGKTYFLASMGGSAHGTEFLAISEMSVVQLPPGFGLEQLKDKDVKEQVRIVFTARLRENEQQRHMLEAERKLLDKALRLPKRTKD